MAFTPSSFTTILRPLAMQHNHDYQQQRSQQQQQQQQQHQHSAHTAMQAMPIVQRSPTAPGSLSHAGPALSPPRQQTYASYSTSPTPPASLPTRRQDLLAGPGYNRTARRGGGVSSPAIDHTRDDYYLQELHQQQQQRMVDRSPEQTRQALRRSQSQRASPSPRKGSQDHFQPAVNAPALPPMPPQTNNYIVPAFQPLSPLSSPPALEPTSIGPPVVAASSHIIPPPPRQHSSKSNSPVLATQGLPLSSAPASASKASSYAAILQTLRREAASSSSNCGRSDLSNFATLLSPDGEDLPPAPPPPLDDYTPPRRTSNERTRETRDPLPSARSARHHPPRTLPGNITEPRPNNGRPAAADQTHQVPPIQNNPLAQSLEPEAEFLDIMVDEPISISPLQPEGAPQGNTITYTSSLNATSLTSHISTQVLFDKHAEMVSLSEALADKCLAALRSRRISAYQALTGMPPPHPIAEQSMLMHLLCITCVDSSFRTALAHANRLLPFANRYSDEPPMYQIACMLLDRCSSTFALSSSPSPPSHSASLAAHEQSTADRVRECLADICAHTPDQAADFLLKVGVPRETVLAPLQRMAVRIATSAIMFLSTEHVDFFQPLPGAPFDRTRMDAGLSAPDDCDDHADADLVNELHALAISDLFTHLESRVRASASPQVDARARGPFYALLEQTPAASGTPVRLPPVSPPPRIPLPSGRLYTGPVVYFVSSPGLYLRSDPSVVLCKARVWCRQ